jgi:hypothetical protein
MGRFYKTHSAPIVDYSYKYPFKELLVATQYKNELQQSRLDKMQDAYDDVLGVNFIPNTGDHTYVQEKRQEIEELVNKYGNTDLTSNVWGNINSEINKIARDPNLVDIQTTYNNFVKDQANQLALQKSGKFRSCDAFGNCGDPRIEIEGDEERGVWDTPTMGPWTGTTPAYQDPKPGMKKIFDNMASSEVAMPDGTIVSMVTTDDVARVANKNAPEFADSAEGLQVITDYRTENPTSDLSDVQIAEEALRNWGNKLIGQEITAGGGGSGSGSGQDSGGLGLNTGTQWAVTPDGSTPIQYAPVFFGGELSPGRNTYNLAPGDKVYVNPQKVNTPTTEGALNAFSIGIYKDYKKQVNPIENNLTEANLELNNLKNKLERGTKLYIIGSESHMIPLTAEEKAGIKAQISEQEVLIDQYNEEIENTADEFGNAYAIDVTDPALEVLAGKWKANKDEYTKEDIDNMTDDERRSLLAMDMSDIISEMGGNAIWQAVPGAKTKDLMIGNEGGIPVMGKHINGNVLLEAGALNSVMTSRGYGASGWTFGWSEGTGVGSWGKKDWDEAMVGPNKLFQEIADPTVYGLDADKTWYMMKNSWRQVADNWMHVDQLNQISGVDYGTGQKGIAAQEAQKQLYIKERALQAQEQVNAFNAQRKQSDTQRLATRMYNPGAGYKNEGGQSITKLQIEKNMKDFVTTLREQGELNPESGDLAERLSSYLVDLDAMEGGILKPKKVEGGKYNDNVREITELSQFFLRPISAENQVGELRKFLASKENTTGTYNGVPYIENNKLVNEEVYKTAATERATDLGLDPIEPTNYPNMTVSNQVYAPYLNKSAMSFLTLLNNLGTPFTLTGAYRTPEYNKVVEGVDNSFHKLGKAIDVAPNENLLRTIQSLPGIVKKDGKWVYKDMFTVLDEGDHLHFEILSQP